MQGQLTPVLMDPLVSILIPAYNAERWIADTLQSALGQTWRRREIIVVDDGSRDGTLAAARRFESAQVRVGTQSNAGAAAARNQALALAQGDFIQWLDADDLLAPDKIGRQMEVAEREGDNRRLLSSAWGSFMYRWWRATFCPTALWHDLGALEWLSLQMEKNLHMQTATWLVSRELTDAAGPWESRLAACASDDGEYFCRVLLASKGTRFVPEAKVFYRMPTSSNLSHIGMSARKMEAQILGLELYISHVRARDDAERTRVACVRFLQNWVHNFYPHRPDLVERAQQLARTLGGSLEEPRLGWKYSWIQKTAGWPMAKRASILAPQLRWGCVRWWDQLMFKLDGRGGPGIGPEAGHDSTKPGPSVAP